MKKLLYLFMAFAVSPLFAAGLDVDNDEVRLAVYDALDQARIALKSAPFGKRTVAVLPFPGDKAGLFTGKLKNLLTAAGFSCIEGKEDPMWNEIIKEIAWDERKDDILDPATLVKFGKLKAAQILLYGKVAVLDKNSDRIYAEIELHATDLTTKRHIWGGTFAARFYKNKTLQGIISLDAELKKLLKKSFATAKVSLSSPASADKLGKVGRITVMPLAGDIDEYMTGLAIEMFTSTRFLPKRPQIPSLSQLRSLAKAKPAAGEAVFYGAVRDLHRTAPAAKAVNRKTMRETSTVSADIQLFLEDLKTGTILWSKTITLAEPITVDRALTPAERQAKIDAFGSDILEDLTDNWKHYLAVAGGVVAVLALLLLIVIGIKAWVSYNNVR